VAGQGDAQGGRLAGFGRGAFVGQGDASLTVYVGQRAAGQRCPGQSQQQDQNEQDAKDDEQDANGAVHSVLLFDDYVRFVPE
jgi:hypothetical protein